MFDFVFHSQLLKKEFDQIVLVNKIEELLLVATLIIIKLKSLSPS